MPRNVQCGIQGPRCFKSGKPTEETTTTNGNKTSLMWAVIDLTPKLRKVVVTCIACRRFAIDAVEQLRHRYIVKPFQAHLEFEAERQRQKQEYEASEAEARSRANAAFADETKEGITN